ncbi:MAG: CoA transferase [Dehalococcoidia bacterium]
MTGALARLRVLDLSRMVSGPYAGRLLAGFGADVIKVEPPAGDPSRRAGPFPGDIPDPEASALFLHLNTGKRGVTLDLTTAQGRALLLDLVAGADVLLENFAPGELERLGMDDGALPRANPDLIHLSITPFGASGPYRDYVAGDLVLQAMSTMMSHTGEPGRPPLKLFGYQAYYVAGAHAAVAALAALRGRDATGGPRRIDLSVLECAANIIAATLTSWSYNRVVTGRRGHGRGAWGVYPCDDGFISISVYHHGREWHDFVEMLGYDALRDPKFGTSSGRFDNIEELETYILGWVMGRGKKELAEIGRRHRIAIGYDASMADLFDSPQLRARGFFAPIDHPVAGRQTYTGAPMKLSATPWAMDRPAPLLGQHNAEVYGALGRTPAHLAALRGMGAI